MEAATSVNKGFKAPCKAEASEESESEFGCDLEVVLDLPALVLSPVAEDDEPLCPLICTCATVLEFE